MNDFTLKNDIINLEKKIENKENTNKTEIMNLLDKKADKESVYNSLKLKSDKNEMNTVLCNKLDKADLAVIIKALGEKLNKNDFFKYKEDKEKENKKHLGSKDDNMFDYNLNIINYIKDINKDVQDMKKNVNKRIDIINNDIERLLKNLNNKLDSMNTVINNIIKNKIEDDTYNNLSDLLKKKLDIEKFDIFIKKIKNNLENNFIEISKNLEELTENKFKKINQNISSVLEKQNMTINNYIIKNKNDLEDYQIRVQGIINKINNENRLELNKLKNEFIEKIDEKLTTDKFYNLSEETKNKNNLNLNQISPENKLNNNNSYLLNSNENTMNENNIQKENKIKEIKDIYTKIEEIEKDIKINKNEFSNTMENQALINEILSNENNLGRWIWDSGKINNNFNIIWDTQKINTSPNNYKLENDNSIIKINDEGIYEIILGFYINNKKPNIQILVDNEVVISNSNNDNNNSLCYNTIYSGFMKINKNNLDNGNLKNVTGLTIIDFILLPSNAKISVFYNGDIGKGFLGLKKL